MATNQGLSSVKRYRRLAAIMAVIAMAAATVGSTAGDPPPATARPSLADPNHLWNRLRNRLHVRVDSEFKAPPDQLSSDLNEHDPLQWSRIWFPKPVNYLFKGKAYEEAVALLDEFLAKHGEQLESDPLQRALLQHDLWALFDYVSDPDWSNPLKLQPAPRQYRGERREFARRLAAIIGRLALTNDQIGKLPDNYAAAVAARKYPPSFDAQHPKEPFLPAELWDPEGPWVLVSEWANNPLAIRHTAFFGGRSTFVVFLRLPGGRAATVDYLKKLREWKPKPGENIPPNGNAIPPQVPPHTQFALARRMMVISRDTEMVPTRLTEAVQVRVLPDPAKEGETQTFLEHRLRRLDLAAGNAGGLSAVQKNELDRVDMLDLGPRNDDEGREPILTSCRNCHTDKGILSMNSYTGGMDNVSGVRGLRSLVEGPLKGQEDATIAWKQKRYDWGLLSGLRERKTRD